MLVSGWAKCDWKLACVLINGRGNRARHGAGDSHTPCRFSVSERRTDIYGHFHGEISLDSLSWMKTGLDLFSLG